MFVSGFFLYCALQFFVLLFFFFFSSRRRHTRCLSDWSSDVCSSDLNMNAERRLHMPLDLADDLGDLMRERASVGIAQNQDVGAPFLGSAKGTQSIRSEEHTSELQSLRHLVCRLLLEKKNKKKKTQYS